MCNPWRSGGPVELVVNIIDNGIKYNLPQGKVEISFKKEEDFIVTQAADPGVGIPEEDLGKVLDRFTGSINPVPKRSVVQD